MTMAYTVAHLQHATDRVEQPPVRVDLLLVLRLDDQDNLDRHEVVGVLTRRNDKLRRGVDGQLGRVLQRVSEVAT